MAQSTEPPAVSSHAAPPPAASDENIWTKCPTCKEIAFRKEVERNLNVCPKCAQHFRLTVSQRLSITVDRGSWREMFENLAIGDPLKFVDSRPYPNGWRRRAKRADAMMQS